MLNTLTPRCGSTVPFAEKSDRMPVLFVGHAP
jgi:hypothetical protein